MNEIISQITDTLTGMDSTLLKLKLEYTHGAGTIAGKLISTKIVPADEREDEPAYPVYTVWRFYVNTSEAKPDTPLIGLDGEHIKTYVYDVYLTEPCGRTSYSIIQHAAERYNLG